MSGETKEFKDEQIAVKLTTKPHCVIELQVAVSPLGSAAAHKKAIKEVRKEVELPGFRKGKAPEDVVATRFPKQIDQQFRDILVNTSFADAIRLTGIQPYDRSAIKEVKIHDCSTTDGANLLFVYETFPSIPAVAPEELKLTKIEPPKPTDEQIDFELQQLAFRSAEWQDVVDRPVEEGDYVDLNIVSIHGDHTHPICEDTRFLVKKGKMGNWMYQLIVGKNIGDVVEGMSEREETDRKEGEEEAPFHPTNCRITIKAIKKAELPVIDDAFAKQLGIDTAENLREQVIKLVNKRSERQAQEKMRSKMRQLVLERYPFELPDSLFKREVKSQLEGRMQSLEEQLHHHPVSHEERKKMEKQIEDAAIVEADRFLRLQYLLFSNAKIKNLDVTEREVIEKVIEQSMLPEEDRIVSIDMESEKLFPIIRNVLLMEKSLDYLIDHANIEA